MMTRRPVLNELKSFNLEVLKCDLTAFNPSRCQQQALKTRSSSVKKIQYIGVMRCVNTKCCVCGAIKQQSDVSGNGIFRIANKYASVWSST